VGNVIGDRLKLLRLERDLSQEDIANTFNITRQAYSSWERNEYEPSLDTVSKLAQFYNVTIDYLFGKTNIREDVYKDPKLQEYINECVKIYNKFLKQKDHD